MPQKTKKQQHPTFSPLLLLLFFIPLYHAQFPSDYDTIQTQPNTTKQFQNQKQFFLEHNRPIHVFSAKVASLSQFHLAIPSGGCTSENGGIMQATSVTAKENDCVYATNAGFFNMITGACVGTLVVDGVVVQVVPAEKAGFLVDGKQSSVLVGFFNSSTLQELLESDNGVYQYISGSGWLVREGKNYVNSTPDLDPNSIFVTEHAPRTAVGVDKEGAVWVVEADGQNMAQLGLGLYEFGDMLIGEPFGLVEAINLDGGGSSVSVLDGSVIDYPTCNNDLERCERNVTSITCLKMN